LLKAAAMRILASIGLALTLLASSAAHAESEWYGWQIALADAASIGLMATGQEAPAVVGLVGWIVGGPIIHSAHEDFAAGGGDLVLRLGLPAAGTFIGLGTSHGCEECEGIPAGAGVGLLAGAVAAMALDYGLLSTHERVSVAPMRGGGVLLLAGRF